MLLEARPQGLMCMSVLPLWNCVKTYVASSLTNNAISIVRLFAKPGLCKFICSASVARNKIASGELCLWIAFFHSGNCETGIGIELNFCVKYTTSRDVLK